VRVDIDLLLKGIVEAGKEPLAFVAYIVLVLCMFSVAWKESRIKNIRDALKDLPEDQRLDALKLEYNLEPRDGMDVASFLVLQKRKYYLILGLASLALVLIIGSLGVYRYIQLDKINTVNETMKMAYDALARGTTTADDNRFNNAIGRMEESIKLHPSYQGYMLLSDIYDEAGNSEGALAASRQAAAIDPGNPTPEMNIGMYQKDLGNLDEAEKHLRSAMAKFEAMKRTDAEFKVALLVNLGNVFYERADAARGEERAKHARIALEDFYAPALALFGEVRTESFKANALGNIANNYRILGKFKEAEYYMLQSIAKKEAIYSTDPANRSLGIGHFNLADVYLKQNNLRSAAEQIDLASRIFEKFDFPIGKGSVLMASAELDLRERRFDSARSKLDRARKIFIENNLKTYLSRSEELLEQLPVV
jgi:tetratricopeptide (TPR) repeat protein